MTQTQRTLARVTVLAQLLIACSNTEGSVANDLGGAAGTTTGGAGGETTVGTTTGGAGGTTTGGTTTGPDCSAGTLSYDARVLCDAPVAYWAMSQPSETEPDLTGNGNLGSYQGGMPTTTTLPNGDSAVLFDGVAQYLKIASTPAFSIPTTGSLTWEGWIRPTTLEFPNASGSGYIDWMGKCANYSGPPADCEWEARMYSTTNDEGRCNRLSAYVFNPTAGLGSAADFQPTCGLLQANAWYHVVGAYTTTTQPSTCSNATAYPGSIDIWVNGVKWNQANHNPTGCMSQYSVVPQAGTSPLNIGTMAYDTWFPGAIAKVALYDHLLTDAQVSAHYQAMTGRLPSGSCADTCSF